MKYLLLILALMTLNFSPLTASGVYPVKPIAEKSEIKNSKVVKLKKRIPKNTKKKAESTVLSAIIWYGLIPAAFLTIIVLSFILPGLGWLWFAGLGLFAIWAGVSGIVFFPIQFAGLPLGMASIIYGLIIKSILVWTFGIALVLAALFAFSFMVLMFTIGTRKNQPK
jgi:hypothetical protein